MTGEPNEPDLEEFSPQKFVRGLTPEQLEFLAEFSDHAEAQLEFLAQGTETYRAPTGPELLEVFRVAEEELMDRELLISHALDDEAEEGERHISIAREWAEEFGHELPLTKVKEGKRSPLRLPALLTVDEVRELFRAAGSDRRNGERNHLVIRLLYASGVRRAELISIKVADLSLDRNTIFIRSGKGDKDRYVLIDQDTSNMLRAYTAKMPLEEIVFDVSTRTINRIMDRAAEVSGLDKRFEAMGRKLTVHSLRHAYATHLYEAGADLFLIKTLMGHYNLRVTKMYIYVGVRLLSERYVRTHPLAKPHKLVKGPMPTGFQTNIAER
jgi:site-specific recombinase XerD